MALEQISTDDLEQGMYVSQLDRPWLETPFLFQGFVIKSEAEIEELRRYCEQVYVQPRDAAGAANGSTFRPAQKGRGSRGIVARVAGWFGDRQSRQPQQDPRPGEFYQDSHDVQTELPLAETAFAQASTGLAEAMERIRAGGRLEVHTLDSVVTPMLDSLMRNRDAMAWLSRIQETDDYTYGHSVSCAIYAIALGRHLGLPREDLKTLGLGGLLMDIGKTQIPKELLARAAPLSDAEMALMQSHVLRGEEILREYKDLDPRVLAMVRSHHERYDGSGYPDALKGPDIHVFARIAGIVDFYDALITPRSYAPAVSPFDAMRELHKRGYGEFQPEMVEQFIQAVGVFPNGALVELSSGEVAIVVEQNRVRRLRPKVIVILDAGKKPLQTPRTIDLRERSARPDEPGALWIDRGLETGAYGIDAADYYL
ncbi:MAG: HD-GYP domain-containing protein [Woeseia sp.]